MDDALRQELSRFREREGRSTSPERELLREQLINDLAAVLGLHAEVLQIPSSLAPHTVVAALVFDIQLCEPDVHKATALLVAYRQA